MYLRLQPTAQLWASTPLLIFHYRNKWLWIEHLLHLSTLSSDSKGPQLGYSTETKLSETRYLSLCPVDIGYVCILGLKLLWVTFP